MNKKILALALLAVLTIDARRPDLEEEDDCITGEKAYGLATIVGAAGGLVRVGKDASIYDMGRGALVGMLTVNGWTILVRETADPKIVNAYVGKVLKYGGTAIVAGFVGNAVWNAVFKGTKA